LPLKRNKIASASAPSAFSGCARTSAYHGRTGNGKKTSVYCTCDRVSVSHTQALFFRSYPPSRISFSSWEPLILLTRIFAGGVSENNCKRFRAVGVLRSPHAHRSRTHEDSTVYPCLPRIRGRLDHAGALTAPGIYFSSASASFTFRVTLHTILPLPFSCIPSLLAVRRPHTLRPQ